MWPVSEPASDRQRQVPVHDDIRQSGGRQLGRNGSATGYIASRLRSRDSSVWFDDTIDLWIDPTGNGLRLYHFSTNRSGVKYDALCRSGGHEIDPPWDAHWNVAAGEIEAGWGAE